MPKTTTNAIASIAMLLVTVGAIAVGNSQSPKMPYSDFGACPFECCMYRRWVALKDTDVQRTRQAGAGIAFHVRAGEHVQALTGVVITLRAGVAVAKTSTTIGGQRVGAGERIYILTNLGEGFCKVWCRGRISEAEVFDERVFRIERGAESVWWVKVRNRQGRIGWTNKPVDYGDKDARG